MKKIAIKTGPGKKIFSLAVVATTFALVLVGMTTTVPYIQTALAQTLPGGAVPPPGGGAVPPPGGGAVPPPGGGAAAPPVEEEPVEEEPVEEEPVEEEQLQEDEEEQ